MSVFGFRSLLAVLDAGFRSAGVVMGAASYQLLRPSTCATLTPQFGTEPVIFPRYEEGLQALWLTAVKRLSKDATRVGAHGVVGVGVALTEQSAIVPAMLRLTGTAVRVEGVRPLPRPFLSMLTMEETLKLLLRGWIPTGIAYGLSAVHVHGWAANPWRQAAAWRNAEMTTPTAGMRMARRRAEAGARYTLERTRGSGLIGATVDVTQYPQQCGNDQGMLIEGRVLGTGVVRFGEPAVPITAVRTVSGKVSA